MKVEFLKPTDPRWEACLATVRHDFYHLPGYGLLSESIDHGTAEAALVSEGDQFFFVPFIVRPLAAIPWYRDNGEPLYDACSPYGYPGPLTNGSDADFLDRALAAWREAMGQRRIVSAFVRLHPLLNADVEPLARHGQLVSRGQTVSIDLTLPLEELWRQTRNDHRRNINRARREGMRVEMETDLAHLDEFVSIYHETMDRVAAGRFFYFPREYFAGLKDVLGDGMVLAVVYDAGGAILCAGCFTECNGIVQFHLSGTRSEALKRQPSKLMLDEVRRWAKQRGNRAFHLGGGTGGDDALLKFKAGFSELRHSAFTWHVTFLDDAYADLTARRDRHVERARDPNFFPAYRA